MGQFEVVNENKTGGSVSLSYTEKQNTLSIKHSDIETKYFFNDINI